VSKPRTSSERPGLLVVLSSPSGAGKTTLANRLRAAFPELVFSVSVTTRPMRPGEVDGVHYRFVDDAAFDRMVEGGELAEWAAVHGHRYGTPALYVEQALAGGRDVLFDIDFQGGRQLRARFAGSFVGIFILPPSLEALSGRLRRRATESEAAIALRLRNALDEAREYPFYDYVVVNDDLEEAVSDVCAIVRAARRAQRRMAPQAEAFVERTRRAGGDPPAKGSRG
jgi:guanylate kinase